MSRPIPEKGTDTRSARRIPLFRFLGLPLFPGLRIKRNIRGNLGSFDPGPRGPDPSAGRRAASMIGIFLVGCFITAIVSTACVLVVLGLREAKADLDQRKETNQVTRPSTAD